MCVFEGHYQNLFLNILVWQDVRGSDGEDGDGEMMVVRNVCDTAPPRCKCVESIKLYNTYTQA